MNNDLFTRLQSIVCAITRGDFLRGREFSSLTDGQDLDPEKEKFIESLDLMALKLEAREMALEEKINDLRSKNKKLTLAKQKNQLFSTIFVNLFLGVSLYVFMIFLARDLNFHVQDSARIVEAIFLGVCILIIRKSGFSFSFFGITRKGAAESIRSILPSTLAVCAGLIALKALCIRLKVPGLNNELVIFAHFDLLLLIYLPVAFLQEFLARGVIQTAVESVLGGPKAALWAIITSSALFGLVHIQLSVAVAFASFICSIYWGHFYTRRRTLAGVGISHFLIGAMAYILGFWGYMFKI
ncbi:CPBP family intramembrane glutamic endopeptidase [Desulfoplanes sp.]